MAKKIKSIAQLKAVAAEKTKKPRNARVSPSKAIAPRANSLPQMGEVIPDTTVRPPKRSRPNTAPKVGKATNLPAITVKATKVSMSPMKAAAKGGSLLSALKKMAGGMGAGVLGMLEPEEISEAQSGERGYPAKPTSLKGLRSMISDKAKNPMADYPMAEAPKPDRTKAMKKAVGKVKAMADDDVFESARKELEESKREVESTGKELLKMKK